MKNSLLILSLALFSINAFAQNVNIPDPIFKAALLADPFINYNSDNEIQVSEAVATYQIMDCGYHSTDLTGLAAFTNLNDLDCSYSHITTLDLSQYPNLRKLKCTGTPLLTSINLTQNDSLTNLNAGSYSTNGTGCDTIDLSNNKILKLLNVGGVNLTTLVLPAGNSLKQIQVLSSAMTDLDITPCLGLEFLDCSNSPLLTKLELSMQNIKFMNLYCNNTNIDSLDVSNIPVFKDLLVDDNPNLIYLNVANGNNANFDRMLARNNPNLSCIQVDDSLYASMNFAKDSLARFSKYCYAPMSSSTIFSFEDISIYPIPTNEILEINSPDSFPYSLFNLNGQLLKKGNLKSGYSQLSLSEFNSGIFYITLFNSNGTKITKRIIKN